MTLTLVLVRHGVTDWNREGRFQGQLDPPLSDAGRHEASLLARRLADDERLRPNRIVSSSLSRAAETAAAIAEACGAPFDTEPRLMEIGQGEWEGRTHAEIEVEDPERYGAWRSAAGVRQPPGGESIASVSRRVEGLLATLHNEEDGTICLVSHGGTMRVLARSLFALPDDRSWAFDIDNASIGATSRHGHVWRLERWNDTLHLLGIEPTHVDEAEGRPLAL